jgi:protein TonB
MTRRELSPAMMGSVLLHAAVAAALLISWNFARDLKVGAVVPVRVVSNAPATDLRAAVEAPVEQTAQTEQPAPEAPPEPLAPAPEPKPAPPKPEPKAAKPEKSLDLDALAASLTRTVQAARPSSGPRGPSRPETAQQARPSLGSGQAAAALSGLTEELQRRWNPNCEVEGGRDVQVRVTFQLGAGGQVVGDAVPEIRSARSPVSQAGADRAVRAVYAASPFRNLPQEFHGQRVRVNFNAREACSQ